MKPRRTLCTPNIAEGLLLRNPLTQAHSPTKFLHSKGHKNVRPETMNGSYITERMQGRGNNSVMFHTRHNPHPIRVKHLKGLLDNPVCMVEDNIERHLLWSAPSGEHDIVVSYRPAQNTRYSANKFKSIPAIGIVPVTYAWKDELEKKTYNAISKALGEPPGLPTLPPIIGKQCQTDEQFDSLNDEQLLVLLCKILQTDSIPACQTWLQSASDAEKNIVLNMLHMAATGEINPHSKQHRPTSTQSVYIWNNTATQPDKQLPDLKQTTLGPDPPSPIDDLNGPFNLPVHDTIIRSAHSQLSMKQDISFHDRLQNELDLIESQRQHSHLSKPSCSHTSRTVSSQQKPRQISTRLVGGSGRPGSRPQSKNSGSRRSCKEQFNQNIHLHPSKWNSEKYCGK